MSEVKVLVMPAPDDTPRQCRSHYRDMRCAKRPHMIGWHVACDVEANCIVYWGMLPESPLRRELSPKPKVASPPFENVEMLCLRCNTLTVAAKGGPRPLCVACQAAQLRPAAKAVRVVPPSTYTTGEMCLACGSLNLINTGTCSTCQDCGEDTGCG